jgi:hypothetical protein
MAAGHATVTHVTNSQRIEARFVEERQEGGDRLPPQFRIQSEARSPI